MHCHNPPAADQTLADMICNYDWASTGLGPTWSWPPQLKCAVDIAIPSGAQIVLFCGDDFTAIYNDAYAPTIGTKHPGALGRPAKEKWGELWDDLEPLLLKVRETGETVVAKDRPFYMNGMSNRKPSISTFPILRLPTNMVVFSPYCVSSTKRLNGSATRRRSSAWRLSFPLRKMQSLASTLT